MLSKRLEGRPSSQLEDSPMAHQSSTILGYADSNHSLRRLWGCSVPEDQLPVELPRDVVFDGKGNPLETSESFLNVCCPDCGKDARRETDTMDTFVDSSWYFLRYTDANNLEQWYDADIADYWMNVDFYCGGIEHAQMHPDLRPILYQGSSRSRLPQHR